MSRIAPEIWAHLEQTRPVGENLCARRAIGEVTDRLQSALDADGRRHLLIALEPQDEAFRDEQSRGLAVFTRDLAIQGQPSARWLDIQCHDAAGHVAFDLIGGEVADQLAVGSRTPAEIVRRVLAKWRRFWGQLPQSLLSRDELLGLFAEMWFLLQWLIPQIGPAAAVSGWRGPFGARHDFEWLGGSVEVKATSSTRGRIHWINGIEQLLPPDNGALFFFSLRVREEAGALHTLPSLIERVRAKLGPESDSLARFDTALVQTHYSPLHEAEYSQVRLHVIEEALFAVREDFPKLTSADFKHGVPAGVERVEYEINLNTYDRLRLKSLPAFSAITALPESTNV